MKNLIIATAMLFLTIVPAIAQVHTGPGSMTLGATVIPPGGIAGTASNPVQNLYLSLPVVGGPNASQSFTDYIDSTANGEFTVGSDVADAHNPHADPFLCKAWNHSCIYDTFYIANNGDGLLTAAVATGGTGFSTPCTIPLVGGTFPSGATQPTAAVLTVTSVSGGVVTGVSISTVGIYAPGGAPTGTVSQGTASCGGTGASFTITSTNETLGVTTNPMTFGFGSGFGVPDMKYVTHTHVNFDATGIMGAQERNLESSFGDVVHDESSVMGGNEGFHRRGLTTSNGVFEHWNANTGQSTEFDFKISGSNAWVMKFFSGELDFQDSQGTAWMKVLGSAGSETVSIGNTNPLTVSSVGVLGLHPTTWTDTQPCNPGQISVDASFIYVCTATNTVERVALSSF
jgi:hypothetical protein